MCNRINDTGKKTPYCNSFCDCVDWSNAEEWVQHLHESLIVERDALTYDSLDTLADKPAVLCVLGRCKKCGKQICFGGELKDIQTFDALMGRLFRDVFCCDKNNERDIGYAVVGLLHEVDRDRALEWVHLNRGNPSKNQFSSINPKFNERVRHVAGYTFELYKNLYTGLGPDNADLAMIAELSASDVDWLQEQHAIRVKREIEIVDKITDYAEMWNRYALETRMFGDAIDVAKAERPKHTNNNWVQYDDRRVTVHEISNAVYKMQIRMEAPDSAAEKQIGTVWWKLMVNAVPECEKYYGTSVISGGRKRKFQKGEDAERYIIGRKNAYAKYFVEVFPSVPKELAHYFRVNFVLLPEYTLKKSE